MQDIYKFSFISETYQILGTTSDDMLSLPAV